ncbi:formate dehydrogenase subunit gamma [Trinickia fusca]|uniref:Formate dehydrogenase subunit gamma n=1 Tax=Trinickia fusca TaxID=2419777 RepID=A0A494X755_9BURK|nr:formate dehydrogenase subunit gamma [Trinickia fusca]RKP46428.1 formate dehydrogenase subunit gamma [Trinickia fusca]
MTPADRDIPSRIVRYTAGERALHWITAITFVLLALSGLAMFHPAMFWLATLFGGGQWTRILHPFVGIVMFVVFLLLALRMARHNLLDRDDVRWLTQLDDVLAKRDEALPDVGRYNAGQKLLFFVLVLCLLLLLVSGIGIWRPYFAWKLSIGTVRLASVVHAVAAFVLILGIIVHVYAAIWVKGSVSAMIRGTVTLGWARRHHAKWFRESIK